MSTAGRHTPAGCSSTAVNLNVDPRPGVLWQVTSPFIMRASSREIARPSPVPPNRRVVELSP